MAIYDTIFSMDNFFSTQANVEDNSLNSQYDNLKDNYEKIFIEAAESIRREVNAFKPEDACKKCNIKDCKIEKKDMFAAYPPACPYRDWQLKILTFLSGDYRQKLKAIYKNMMEKKNNYSCNNCAACCKLAASQYSYEQLKQRAMRGDKFAKDFVSVFVPYKSEEDAKKANPEYFELLNKLVEDEKIYYYYCPKLNGNLCSDYENRPAVCRDFPHNPLKLLPSECSYNAWKNEIAHEAMLLKAKVDIIDYYGSKLK